MTARARYRRLEAIGRWCDAPGAPCREVVVAFGKATLTLYDLDDRPLGHWALAGVSVRARDGANAVYAMSPKAGETLAIGDPEMIAAIAAVTRSEPAAAARRRRPALRAVLVAAAGLAAAGLPLTGFVSLKSVSKPDRIP
jgi:hypothetical protein